MSVKVEKQEHNMVKLTIEVEAEKFIEACKVAYNKNKGSISVPGFRKGHVPQALIERMYGEGVFYEDAANELIGETYEEESESTGLTFVSRPEIDVEQIEKGKPFIYTALVAVRPEVALGEYKGIEVTKQNTLVTDDDIAERLKSEQEKNSRLVEVNRPVEDGDTVVLDYAGTVDGEAFDGGTAENQTLVIGSGTFIPGFEEQLIGLMAGEEKDVTVTFPEEYHAEELAGEEAVFHCVIKKVEEKELPELDDDFAQDVSEFDTLDEYKNSLREAIQKEKEDDARSAKETEAVDKLIETSEMDIPEAMIDFQVENMYRNYANQLRSQGIPIEDYLGYMGQTPEGFREQIRPQALRQIQTRLVLEAVAKAENIEVSDERIDEELAKLAQQAGVETERAREMMGEDGIADMKEDLAVQDAISFLADNAVEVEKKEEEKSDE